MAKSIGIRLIYVSIRWYGVAVAHFAISRDAPFPAASVYHNSTLGAADDRRPSHQTRRVLRYLPPRISPKLQLLVALDIVNVMELSGELRLGRRRPFPLVLPLCQSGELLYVGLGRPLSDHSPGPRVASARWGQSPSMATQCQPTTAATIVRRDRFILRIVHLACPAFLVPEVRLASSSD